MCCVFVATKRELGVSIFSIPSAFQPSDWLRCGAFVFYVNPMYAPNTKNRTIGPGEGLSRSATRHFAPIDSSSKQRGPKPTSRGSSDLYSSSARGSPQIKGEKSLITESRVRVLWGGLLFFFLVFYFLALCTSIESLQDSIQQ